VLLPWGYRELERCARCFRCRALFWDCEHYKGREGLHLQGASNAERFRSVSEVMWFAASAVTNC
jgi:uncharacterized protein with PIN domain